MFRRTALFFTCIVICSISLIDGMDSSVNARTQMQTEIQPPKLDSAIKSIKVSGNSRVHQIPCGACLHFTFFYSPKPCKKADPEIVLGTIRVCNQSCEPIEFSPFDIAFPFDLPETGGSVLSSLRNPDGSTQPPECVPVTIINLSNTTTAPDIAPSDNTLNSAVSSSKISGTFFGLPNTVYDLEFFFTPASTNSVCSEQQSQSLNLLPIKILTNENGMKDFTVDLASPPTEGFINCKAASPSGTVSLSSDCLPIVKPSCPPKIVPNGANIDKSGKQGSISVIAENSCNTVTADSPVDWIKIQSIDQPSDTERFRSVKYVVEPNTSNALRIGAIRVNDQIITITQQAEEKLIPVISDYKISGKSLLLFGENFNAETIVLINGKPQKKTTYEPPNILITNKAAKKVKQGTKIQVQSSDGTKSNEIVI